MKLHHLTRKSATRAPGTAPRLDVSRLQLFAEPPATDPNNPPPADPPTRVKVPIGGPKTDPKTDSPTDPKPEEKPYAVFPDKATLQDRLDRASKAGKEALAKELGFESVEAMTTAAKAAKAAEEAAKTESQRQAEALAAAQKAVQEAEAAKTESLTKADQKVIKAEIRSLARTMGAVDVDMVQLALDAAKAEIKVDEDGNVTGAQEALDALKVSKAYLFGTAKQTPAPVGGPLNPPKTPPANMTEASQEEFTAEASKYGLRPHSGTMLQNPTRKG